ncbi:MAG: TAT-variant-translocated molybdopterin oxidoreductase [Bacteroidota bacterium]|nr:TAT-variant-translocated molybdopterin oxidoreductase [Bacteroidota bacterium]
MATNKKYWKAFEDLVDAPVVQKLRENEFAEEIPVEDFLGDKQKLESSSTTRRDFLKYLGFSTAAATLAACEAPIIESIPYVVKPEELIPGIPNFYATTYFDGFDFASVLVKTREGRPIKIEPNPEATFNGTTSARIQGTVLSLYDSGRLQGPMKDGQSTNWDSALAEIKKELTTQAGNGKQVVLLTGTVISPSLKALIAEFAAIFPNFRHVTHDAVSASGKLDFYQKTIGKRALPFINLSKAKLIVGVGADFLGDHTGQAMMKEYGMVRKPGKGMARHIQVEANMTLTGSNADKRVKLKPSMHGSALTYIYNGVSGSSLSVGALDDMAKKQLDAIIKELQANRGQSVVMAGGNDEASEAMAFAINKALGNVPSVVDTDHLVYLRQGDDKAVSSMVNDMKSGSVGGIITVGVNPNYTLNPSLGYAEAVAKVPVRATFTDRLDESAGLMTYALPLTHFLESWGDAMPTSKTYALSQPTIRPLFNTKQFEEALMVWIGKDGSYYDYLKSYYNQNIDVTLGSKGWNQVLHDGVAMVAEEPVAEDTNTNPEEEAPAMDLSGAAATLKKMADGAKGMEITFYTKAGVGTGVQANNPWLQELPDPITRISWDNYITISRKDAEELGLFNEYNSAGALNGSKVTLTVGGQTLENVPVIIQPGQTHGTIGLAVGYGRTHSGKAANGVGVNAYSVMNGGSWASDTSIADAGEHEFATIQIGHTMMGRKIVNEVSLSDFLSKDVSEWNEKPVFETYRGPLTADETNLWDDFDHETMPMWNMSIDLNSCIGCGACVVACHLENNVPVVGKQEVRNLRDMHWLRIDRYYSSDMNEEVAAEQGIGAIDKFQAMEEPAESPEVVFQPVMCQHCNHAPCETVCPVAATSHSAEGLNHMAYNRCIGTRYCANNCPYKVRRFNWFNYIGNEKFADVNPTQDQYGKMVLNPDVTVRSRGVMEKCSMCIQRIQLGKLEAKKEGRPVKDGDVITACAQACPTHAITFGNVNDKESVITKAKEDHRAYHLLEEVGTQPSVFYQTKVRNRA